VTCPSVYAVRSAGSIASRPRTPSDSVFLHGEQGALVCTAKIVQQVPNLDAKFYASTQVIDEARHVEAYAGQRLILGAP
jgi:hypothetical protein